MSRRILRSLLFATLVVACASLASDAFAQYPTVPNDYWASYWNWFDNTYRPYGMRHFGPVPAPADLSRESWYRSSYPNAAWAPNGYISPGGSYQSGLFPRVSPYGWW